MTNEEQALRMDIINKGGSPEWTLRKLGDRLYSSDEIMALRAEAALAEREANIEAATDCYNANTYKAMVIDEVIAAIRARTSTQAEGKTVLWKSYRPCDCPYEIRSECKEPGCPVHRFAYPQPPASPSQEGGMREALEAIGRRARCDGTRTFDECVRDLGWIDDECRRIRAALAHDGGRGKD